MSEFYIQITIELVTNWNYYLPEINTAIDKRGGAIYLENIETYYKR